MTRILTKSRHEMSIAELIADSGWWFGSEREWQALPLPEREKIAFERTGCAVAYPTWQRPVDCVHTECQILRGELPKIALTNRILRGEAESGWLHFHRTDVRGTEGRRKLAKIFRVYRKLARETGEYDPWKLGWQGIVYAAIQ